VAKHVILGHGHAVLFLTSSSGAKEVAEEEEEVQVEEEDSKMSGLHLPSLED
jgi:hypothetical protein